MNRQTLQAKESAPAKKSSFSWLRSAAARPAAEAEHEAPSASSSSFAHDFTKVPVRPMQLPGVPGFSCPFAPQRCPSGGACHTCPPKMQAKLKIGQPGDRYEQEADRVAETVMRMPEPQVQRKGCSAPGCKDEDEDKLVQTKSAGSAGNAQVDHPLIQSVLASPGQPLDAGTRSFMEPRFGQDFSGVRVHVGGQAAESARAVNARAYTVGRDVVFGEGQYAPGSDEGKRLVAHELVHVGQQRNSKDQKIQCRHVLENDPATAPSMTCNRATSIPDGVVSLDVIFDRNSSTLSAADRAAVSNFVRNWHLTKMTEPVRVDGYASIDGPPSLNWPLSCRRAETLANELMTPSDGSSGIPASNITIFAHGETAQFSSALELNRRVQAYSPSISSSTPQTNPVCSGSYTDGNNETADTDHDLDQLHHSGERSPDVVFYDYIGGELGAKIDFWAGYSAGTAFESTNDGDTLYEHFMTGSGYKINFPASSDIASIIEMSPTFTTFAVRFERDILSYFKKNDTLCGYDGNTYLASNRPSYFHRPLFAWTVMGGYSRIDARVMQLPSGNVGVTYKIYDHYGAGVSDAWSYLLGLSAMYYLQHFHGMWGTKYTPYVWSVEINRLV